MGNIRNRYCGYILVILKWGIEMFISKVGEYLDNLGEIVPYLHW